MLFCFPDTAALFPKDLWKGYAKKKRMVKFFTEKYVTTCCKDRSAIKPFSRDMRLIFFELHNRESMILSSSYELRELFFFFFCFASKVKNFFSTFSNQTVQSGCSAVKKIFKWKWTRGIKGAIMHLSKIKQWQLYKKNCLSFYSIVITWKIFL